MLSYSTFADLFGLGLEVEISVPGPETHND